MNTYILDGKIPMLECDILVWGKWFEEANRHVGNDHIGDVHISTVFLGLDHNYFVGAPILFETMIFGGEFDNEMERYETWEQAEQGHRNWVDKVKQSKRKEQP